MEFIKPILQAGSQSGDKEQSQSDQNKEGGHVFQLSLDDIRAGHHTKLPLGPGKGSIFLPELPPDEDINLRLELSKLMDDGVRIMTPLSEQLKCPLPKATVVLNLEDLSAGAQNQLPKGTPLGVDVDGDLEEDGLTVLHGMPYVEVVLPKFQLRTLEEEEMEHMINSLNDLTQHPAFKNLSVIPRIQFPENIKKDDLLKFGDALSRRKPSGSVLLDAPGHSTDLLEYVSLSACHRLELSKLMDGGVKIMTRLSEQLKRPLPKAIYRPCRKLKDVHVSRCPAPTPKSTDVGLFLEKRSLPGDLVILGDIENMQFVHRKFQLRTSEQEKEKEFLMSRVGDITQDMAFRELESCCDKNTRKHYDDVQKFLAD